MVPYVENGDWVIIRHRGCWGITGGTLEPGEDYLAVGRDAVHIVVSSFEGDGPPGSRNVQRYVENATAIYEEFRQAGVPVGEIFDLSWGNIDFSFADPDGNSIIIAQHKTG